MTLFISTLPMRTPCIIILQRQFSFSANPKLTGYLVLLCLRIFPVALTIIGRMVTTCISHICRTSSVRVKYLLIFSACTLPILHGMGTAKLTIIVLFSSLKVSTRSGILLGIVRSSYSSIIGTLHLLILWLVLIVRLILCLPKISPSEAQVYYLPYPVISMEVGL